MTSLAFIFGTLPLVFASGAVANSRHSLGTGVVGGMTVATALGVFFIPVLYVLVAGGLGRRRPSGPIAPRWAAPASRSTSARSSGSSHGGEPN